MIRIFLGHDRQQPVLFHVLSHSLILRSSRPVSITPISLDHLTDVLTRDRHPLQSTEFSFSRFLAPYLCDYQGWALFMDNDCLVRGDIAELWGMRDDKYAVMCVKHDHVPKSDVKFLGAAQTRYEKKNWSSVMLLNCARCRALTPEYVNEATGLELHRFEWLEGDDLIGAIPPEWNHLVGYDKDAAGAKVLHFTEGGPYYKGYPGDETSNEWLAMFRAANCTSDSSVNDLVESADEALGKLS